MITIWQITMRETDKKIMVWLSNLAAILVKCGLKFGDGACTVSKHTISKTETIKIVG
jgi:hypothetical protein